ncbi:F-box only protein 34 [Pangasianodon hypophthalmus]|uniref:F-box only protein 34 n=1 Tax=Pangasianodon hypophthalmus TaxID=310915 RepID=UPI000EFEC5D6|nr:F-box only protein 34 [Pangasianodon hypophthalmus]XP_026789963.3 F-box only protein 34 [Pangasianodon hypophthalmus]XP_026789965.3 F-box only protein 34 [Pangasianodon hypophthalmus]XP_053093331.1 F-box only protein 34 [Pangasianodon hypophthalmus]
MPQKCETISYCSPTPYREPRKQTSHPQKIWRFSAMHLKPYPKPQDKEHHQDRGQDGTGNLVGQRGVLRTEWGVRQACSLMGSPGNGTVNRYPLSVISTNTLRCTTNNNSTPPTRGSGGFSNSWSHKSKISSSVTTFTSSLVLLSSSTDMENEGSLGIYQGEDGEGSLDIWAVIKPGNTKEKIAIFTSQKCSHVAAGSNDKVFEKEGITTDLRTVSMKSKGCWDGDWSMAKRRKRSGNLEKSRCITPPGQKSEFCTTLLNSSKNSNASSGIAGEIVKTDGEESGKTISVVEMVAYLEQRASNQRVDPKRPSLRSSSTITLSKGLSLLPPAEQVSKGPQLSEVHEEEESVRVLDMVAKLESQCLSRQSVREGGDLSRNNSLRRRVGRVLLAGSEPYSAVLPSQEALPSLPQDERADSHSEQVASDVDKPRAPPEACVPVHSEHFALRVRNMTEQETCVKVDTINSLCILANQASSETHECIEEPLPGMLFFAQSPPQAPLEQRCYSNSKNSSISNNTEDSSNDQKNEQSGAPPHKQALEPPSADVSFREENMNKLEDSNDLEEMEEEFGVNNRGPVPLRRLVSHEFLETRFKIQLLLEPQQYMAFLPHHIIVKIFSLLPTESLAALKCTCHYFKFIIESYGVRPADSRWVSDPRYKDDPCKQCKKRYGHGDVSLCRWHHKPYCQALPYGPGYWMCCRGAHKDTPGCNVGLHDNRWVPAFHSINMPIYKKSRDSEDDV